jgi:putative transcriptional regulator
MSSGADLTNHFLIAMPALSDPNFTQTVTYLCEHTPEGAMGIVINRPSEVTLGEVFDQLGIEKACAQASRSTIYVGGPLQQERGFVLHPGGTAWEATLPVSSEVSITTSRDVLTAIASGEGPKEYLIALGYAGWGAGQLEEELIDNAWLSGPADPEVLFRVPSPRRWRAAAALLGVDLSLLSSDSGHA